MPLHAVHARVQPHLEFFGQHARDRAHTGNADETLGGTDLVDAFVIGKRDDPATPAAHEAPVDPALRDRLETMVADCEVLRAVVESAGIRHFRAGTSAGNTALLEDGDPGAAREQLARAGQTGYA